MVGLDGAHEKVWSFGVPMKASNFITIYSGVGICRLHPVNPPVRIVAKLSESQRRFNCWSFFKRVIVGMSLLKGGIVGRSFFKGLIVEVSLFTGVIVR
jgi:hypothetical protein